MLVPCTMQGMRIRGIFSFLGKRISPFDPQEKGIRLAVWSSNNLYASGMKMPARGKAALALRYDLPLLLLSATALPVLRWYSLITVYRGTPQCGERSNATFRRQSAAKQTSLAPHDSKARLRVVANRRRFMAKPCTPHLHCAARAVIQAVSCQCRGSRGAPLVLSLGGVRGIFSFSEREYPPYPRPLHGAGNQLAPYGATI